MFLYLKLAAIESPPRHSVIPIKKTDRVRERCEERARRGITGSSLSDCRYLLLTYPATSSFTSLQTHPCLLHTTTKVSTVEKRKCDLLWTGGGFFWNFIKFAACRILQWVAGWRLNFSKKKL